MTERFEGPIFKNESGRWEIRNGDDWDYWTCGETAELFVGGRWLRGRFEATGGEYYFIPYGPGPNYEETTGFFPLPGTLARRPERR